MTTTQLVLATLWQIATITLSVLAGFLALALPVWAILAIRIIRTSERMRRLSRPLWTQRERAV